MQSIRWGTIIVGVLFVLAGLVLLAGTLGIFQISTGQVCGLFFALLLVGGGLWTIMTFFGAQRTGAPFAQRTFGDQRLGLTDKEFTSRSVSTWIGDTRIDLGQATFPEGESTLSVGAWIGDIRVKVPRDLAVRVRGRVAFVGELDLLGKHREGFFLDVTASSRDYDEAPQRLLVDASVVIGDVSVGRVG